MNGRRLPRGAHSIRPRRGPAGWTALVLVLTLGQPPMAFADDHYTLTDLGGKQWTDQSIARGINAAGQVVGTLSGGLLPAKDHAFLYSEGELHDLHDAVVKAKNCMWNMRTTAVFVTDSGQVVGEVWCSGSVRRGWADSWFVYRNGAAVVAPGTVGSSSKVGEFPVALHGEVHIVRLDEEGTMHDSGALTGFPTGLTRGFVTGMNSTGQVVGYFAESGQWRAWTWREGTLLQLEPFEAKMFSKALAINAAGDIVGTAGRSDDDKHAFLYRGFSMRDLGTLGGRTSVAHGINNKGQIVGWSEGAAASAGGESSQNRAFVYEDGQMKDLTRHLVGPAAQFVTLHDATAINDAGIIAANGRDSRSSGIHAYVLRPARENP